MGFLGLTLLLFACGNQNKKNTPQKTDPVQMSMEFDPEVIFENDYAKVVKVRLAPGESIRPHQGEKRAIYSLSDYAIDWEEKGEALGTKTWKKGEAHYHEAGQHAATNDGTNTAEWLAFIKKNTDLPECGENQINNDVNSVSAEFAKVLLDNDEFKITEVTLRKDASIPMHSGINRIIYSLSDYQITYESDDEGKSEKQFQTGDIHWHQACQHALENDGETNARFLVVSYKRKDVQ